MVKNFTSIVVSYYTVAVMLGGPALLGQEESPQKTLANKDTLGKIEQVTHMRSLNAKLLKEKEKLEYENKGLASTVNDLQNRNNALEIKCDRLEKTIQDLKFELVNRTSKPVKIDVEDRFIRDTAASFLVRSDQFVLFDAKLYPAEMPVEDNNYLDRWSGVYPENFGREHVIEFKNNITPGRRYKVELIALSIGREEQEVDPGFKSRELLKFEALPKQKPPSVAVDPALDSDIRSDSIVVRFTSDVRGYAEITCMKKIPGSPYQEPCPAYGKVEFDRLGRPSGDFKVREREPVALTVSNLEEDTEYILSPIVYSHTGERSGDPMGTFRTYTTTEEPPELDFSGPVQFLMKPGYASISWGITQVPEEVRLELYYGSSTPIVKNLEDMKVDKVASRISVNVPFASESSRQVAGDPNSLPRLMIRMTGFDKRVKIYEIQMGIVLSEHENVNERDEEMIRELDKIARRHGKLPWTYMEALGMTPFFVCQRSEPVHWCH